MGKFQEGQSKPDDSGRKKGTPNKKSLVLKDVLERLGYDLPTKIAELLPRLSVEKQVDVYLQLMPYIYPKRKAIEISGDDTKPLPKVVIISLPDNGFAVKPEKN